MPQAAGMRLIDNGNVFANVHARRERNKFEITRTVPFQGFRSHTETDATPRFSPPQRVDKDDK